MVGKKVLVVEDDPDMVELLQTVLLGLGLTVVVARWGEEGLAAAHELQPDLILLDLTLSAAGSRVDGWELARLLAADDRTAGIPVVAVTAASLEPGATERFAAYLAKPFDLADLRAIVCRCLRRRKGGG